MRFELVDLPIRKHRTRPRPERQLIDRLDWNAGDARARQPDALLRRRGALQQDFAGLVARSRPGGSSATAPAALLHEEAATDDTGTTSTRRWRLALTCSHRHAEGDGDKQDRRGEYEDRLHEIRERRSGCGMRPPSPHSRRGGAHADRDRYFFRCLFTSFVISNMFTVALPPKTDFSVASALIMRLFF